MKKILFVIFTEDFSWGAAILASLAQQLGWYVDVLCVYREDTAADFTKHLETFRPNVVAVSFMSYDRRLALTIARLAKQMGIRVIAGGVHPTFLPQDVVSTKLFDAIVVGDGMGVLKNLLDNIDRLERGRVVQGERHPDRSLYTRLFYSDTQIKRMKQTQSAMLLSSQGCPFKCRFCASGALKYIAYSPKEIVGILDRLHTDYGVINFQFFDDLFAHSAHRCRSIHQEVIKHFSKETKISYGNFVQARASTFNSSIADELVAMGIDCVNFGIETTSTKLIKFLNKNQTEEDCYKAMRICEEYGLVRKVNLMFGIPTQDRDDYESTLRFVKETNPEIKTCFIYAPMPGSDLYNYCFNNNFLPANYDRNSFDWFDDQPDGFVEIQCRLQNVDYDMAIEYKNCIETLGDQMECLLPKVHALDRLPWVIIGTSKTFYFKRFIERLSAIEHCNCLGYIDLAEGGGFSVDKSLPIKVFAGGKQTKPINCITYCYLGGDDFNFMHRIANEYFGNIPLISLASYRNHSLIDIEKLIQTQSS